MMAHKHLQDLLREDQEPFILQSYISDKRCQLQKPTPSVKAQLVQLKKRASISETPNFSAKNFCKNVCFFSFHDSPGVGKSPLFELPAKKKSPCKNSNSVFLHIPTRTAALLLEAASRIQNPSSSPSSTKNKTKNRASGLGLFGSILKRLNNRNRTQNRKIEEEGVNVSVKDILRWDSSVGRRKSPGISEKMKENLVELENINACEINGRHSSAVWSESNEEEKSLDTETSSSGNSDESEEAIHSGLCNSPFRFVLQRDLSSDCQTPDFQSPATSPSRRVDEEGGNYGGEMETKCQVEENIKNAKEEDEEEKEQFSPVSVLDPSFEDDGDDVHEDIDDDDDDDSDDNDGDYDLECSFAYVQRAKHQLLQKLRRFEMLAELDPIELEKRMLEDEQEEENKLDSFDTSTNIDESIVKEVLTKLTLKNHRRAPKDLKKLVTDLITEERNGERKEVVKRVCKRLESLKEVESNTIDMMVEFDFRNEIDGWKRIDQEQVEAAAMEIGIDIFEVLVDELSEELTSLFI